MKIGAQDKKKVAAMAVLLVIAIPLAIHSYSSLASSSPSTTSAAPPATPATAAARTSQKKSPPKVREGTLDPTLRTDILMASQKIEYAGGKRNIFKEEEPPPERIPPTVASVRPTQTPYVAPQPPPLPPIPLKFNGFSSRPGEPKKAFLQHDDNIYVAGEGDVVERRYRVVKITNNFVLIEDILNNNQQQINLTPPPPAG